MYRVDFTEEEITKTKERFKQQGAYKNSITGGAGTVVGWLGEIAFQRIRPEAEHVDTYDCDFISSGARVEVKSKKCSFTPNDNYIVNVNERNTTQECDVYVFFAVYKDLTKAWLLGWEYKSEYFEKAKHWLKGEVDPKNNHTYKDGCYNLTVKQLRHL